MPALRNKGSNLPGWFGLERYRAKLSYSGWYQALVGRYEFQKRVEQLEHGLPSILRAALADEFRAWIVRPPAEEVEPPPADIDQVFPVVSMNRFEVAYLSKISSRYSTSEELLWAERMAREPKAWEIEFSVRQLELKLNAHTPKTTIPPPEVIDDSAGVLGFCLPIMVNLAMDDENIKEAFSIWLQNQREAFEVSLLPKGAVRKGTKKPRASFGFDDREFASWRQIGLLPAFDLTLWKRLSDDRYSDLEIATAIWPSQAASRSGKTPAERFQKSTKPLLLKVFSKAEIHRFIHQYQLTRAIEAMRAEQK